MLRKLRRNARGGTLIEFAFASLLLVTVILTTLEFGVEMFVRNVTERLANRAAHTYAQTRDLSVVDTVLSNQADTITQRCLGVPDVALFDAVSGINPLVAPGVPATGTPIDNTAVMFRLTLRCDWPRITPVMGGLMGSTLGYETTIVSRFLDGGP